MSVIFNLNDGREANIEILDFEQLSECIDKKKENTLIVRTGELCHFEDFTYLGSRVLDDLDSYGRKNYLNDLEKLTYLEIHKNMDLCDKEYHKSLVAFHENDIIGILICEWINDWSYPFWCFHIKCIDVHREYRNLGVGTNIMKSLDDAYFLDSKILQRGIASRDGKLYISHVAENELKAKNYALIPWDYRFKVPPEEVGVYDRSGNLKS